MRLAYEIRSPASLLLLQSPWTTIDSMNGVTIPPTNRPRLACLPNPTSPTSASPASLCVAPEGELMS